MLAGRPKQPEPPAPLPASAEPEEPESKARVLVAEDNVVNQRVITRMLHNLGFHATVVPNGLHAVEAVAENEFDLVLMDVQMPEMDGLTATRTIREAEATTGRHTPIVAVTANSPGRERDDYLEAGMDEFLPKPVKQDLLAETISKVLAPAAV